MNLDDLYFGYLDCLKPLTKTDLLIPDQISIMEQRFGEHINTYIAIDLDNHKIVGTASLVIIPRFVDYQSRYKAALIEDVSVLYEYQNKGVGQQLVCYLINQAKLADAYKCILNCSENNKVFYEKLGFKPSECSMRMDL